MHFRQTLAALTGLVLSVVGAPAPIDHNTTSGGKLKNATNDEKRSLFDTILPPLGNHNIILPGAGLNVLIGSAISQLARIAELELAALIGSQFALAIQLETIKTNIRINHFRAQFPHVVCSLRYYSSVLLTSSPQNCVIICVTNVLDQRDPNNINNRYLLNQLRIDNGFPDKELLIMVTDSQQMTIVPTPTPVTDFSQNPVNSVIPDLNLSPIINNNNNNLTQADILSSSLTDTTASLESESTLFPTATTLPDNTNNAAQPTSSPISPSPTQQPASSLDLGSLIQPTPSPQPRGNSPRQINLVNLPADLSSLPNNDNLDFTHLLSQPLLLPFGITAPTFGSSLGLVLADPAAIIMPGQKEIFVDTLASLQSNCLALQLGLGNTGLGLGGVGFDGQLFGSLEELIQAGVGGLVGGGGRGLNLGQPVIPPGVIAANPDLADEGGVDLVTTVTEELGSTETDTATLTDVLTGTTTTAEDVATGTDTATVTDGPTATETGVATSTEGEVEETASAQARVSRRRRA
ncbi:Putative protein of unknown function [Podospora comata]|uniref:Uncharacterized protein n=1 Tax=Podospora comata TaxID=48703 RepID=A0ABY6SKM8_PODCO|nr:Putative protein of unknown function [Podospora comata]